MRRVVDIELEPRVGMGANGVGLRRMRVLMEASAASSDGEVLGELG
jgi:hypothetical protein